MDTFPLGLSLKSCRNAAIVFAAALTLSAGALHAADEAEPAFTHTHRFGYKLESAFAEHFSGTTEEAFAAFRAELESAAGKLPPGIKLELRPDKRRLFVEFGNENGEALRGSNIAGFLQKSGWWIAPPDPNEARRAAMQAQASQRENAQAWVQAIMQLDDDARRTKALEEIKSALAASDANQQATAIAAFRMGSSVEFDKAAFRPLIEPLLKSPNETVRAGAVGALLALPPHEGDLDRALALVDDPAPEVREALAFVLFSLGKGDLMGRAGEAVLKLLATPNARERLGIVRSLWGAKFSPALEQRLAELAYDSDRDVAYYSVYSALSTQQNKGQKCIDVLIERLGHPDGYNVGGRAMWGMGYGVEPDQRARVADAALKAVQLRADLRQDALRCLKAYGRAEQVRELQAVANKAGVNANLKKEISQVIAEIAPRADLP